MKYAGQHLVVSRGLYTHHGIGDESGGVIHYSGMGDGSKNGPIRRVTINEFARGATIKVKYHSDRKFGILESARRAETRIGENGYSLFGNNCEHFAEWCITGDHSSVQVDRAIVGGTAAVAKTAAGGATVVIASQGAVAGLSGPGVMSGLGAIGRTAGATAIGVSASVGGMVVLGLAGGVGAATALNKTVLSDDENLPGDEREARSAGRVATYVGAATGTAGAIGAVGVAGTTGFSAVGITSGLAAIGGTVGGGMVAGTAIVTAAPVLAAAAVGYGIYKAVKFFRR